MSWYGQRAFTYVLYLPKRESCIELSPSLTQTSPLPGGGVWNRFVLASVNGLRPSHESLTDARLIVLQPVLLDIIQRNLSLPQPVDTAPRHSEDWMLAYRFGFNNAAYLKFYRPRRPDPATCSAEEFARYLRVAISCFPREMAERDLAEYAPRFPELLAKHARARTAADAISSGVPESAKKDVLASIDNPRTAFDLASALDDLGWEADARDSLLACLDPSFMAVAQISGGIAPVVTALAELEDPETYPALLSAYEHTRNPQLYEIIRDLPGIGPELDQVVARISETLPKYPGRNSTATNLLIDTISTFKGPVSHGNPIAFANYLSFVQAYTVNPNTYIPREVKMLIRLEDENSNTWRDLLEGKTISDFSYDPLARRWQLISPTH
jgi:hypothetical protein